MTEPKKGDRKIATNGRIFKVVEYVNSPIGLVWCDLDDSRLFNTHLGASNHNLDTLGPWRLDEVSVTVTNPDPKMNAEQAPTERTRKLRIGDTVDIVATSGTFDSQKNAVGHTGRIVRAERSSGYPGFRVHVLTGESRTKEIWFHADHLKFEWAAEERNET